MRRLATERSGDRQLHRRMNSTHSPGSCRRSGAKPWRPCSPTRTSPRLSIWPRKEWAPIPCALWPPIWAISKHGRWPRPASPSPGLPLRAALKFLAHHLWDPAEREIDPGHGMPDAIAAQLKASGYLRGGRMRPPPSAAGLRTGRHCIAGAGSSPASSHRPSGPRSGWRSGPTPGPRRARARERSRASCSTGCWPPAR